MKSIRGPVCATCGKTTDIHKAHRCKTNWLKDEERVKFKVQLEKQGYACARCGQSFGEVYNRAGIIPGKTVKRDGWLVCRSCA